METAYSFLRVFFVFACNFAFAGRPVFKTHDLKAVTEMSNEVWLAKKISEFSKPVEGTTCAEDFWTLEVLKIIKGDKNNKKLKRVNVSVHESGLRDCLIRQKNKSGASFRAELYKDADHNAPKNPEGFLVFVRWEQKEAKLTINDSYDNISKLVEVESLLTKAKAE